MSDAINPARVMKHPGDARPKYTVDDLATATERSPHDVRRILRRIGEPKNYGDGHIYGWSDFNFSDIAWRVRHWPASTANVFDDDDAA